MKRQTFLTSAALFALALPLGGCGDDNWKDYNYKISIHIGDRAYSAVRHVTLTEGATIQNSSGRRVDRSVEGQAVIVDTSTGPVFALMTPAEGEFGFGQYAAYVAEPAVVPSLGDPNRWSVRGEAATHNAMVQVKGSHDLPRTVPNPDPNRGPRDIPIWPMFVRFGDLTDPKTMREVSPQSIGVQRITIELTNEDTTTGIENMLPWLDHLEKYRSNSENVFTNTLPKEISGLRIELSK
jgi:hypothetical protein